MLIPQAVSTQEKKQRQRCPWEDNEGKRKFFQGEPWRPSLLYNVYESCPGSWKMYWMGGWWRRAEPSLERRRMPFFPPEPQMPLCEAAICYWLLTLGHRKPAISHPFPQETPQCLEFSLHFCLSGALQHPTWQPCCSCMHIHTVGKHSDWDFHLCSSDEGLYKHTRDCRGCILCWP